MEQTVAQKHIGKIAAGIGFLQSTTWFLLSCICLAWHFGGITFEAPTSYQRFWEMMTYSRFLSKDVILSNDSVATPTVIAVFCFAYVFLCAAWFVFSCMLAWGINHNHKKVPLYFRLWGYCTNMVTVVDVVLLIIISVDFNACMDVEINMINPTSAITNEGICTSVFVPVMTIVARGFVLVLVNIGFCIYTIKIGKELGIKAHQGNVINANPYGAISSSGSTIPRAVVQQTPNPYQQYPAPSGSNPYQQYPPSGSNPYQQPQNWGNNPPTSPTRTTGTYPPQQRQVY